MNIPARIALRAPGGTVPGMLRIAAGRGFLAVAYRAGIPHDKNAS